MQFMIPQTVDLRRENPMLRYGQPLGYGDAGAHKWCVTVLDGGKKADMTGVKVTCYFTRAANTAELEQGALIVTVPMEIVTVGNPVEIEFEKACYAGVGRCVAEIRLTKDGWTTTLARMAAELVRHTSDSISDPEHLLPSIDELLAQQKAMIEATETGQAAASAANAAATKANTAATKANTAAAAAEGWAKATVTTETLEAGMDADVALNTAEDGAKVLEFAIPRGNPGVQVGPDEPTDPTVQVWIDTDGEADDLSGLISDERIQTAVDSYLDKSGVASGATAEQAAQIAKNTEAIEDLKENGVGTPGKDGRGIVSMTSDVVLGTPVNVVYTDGTGEVFYVRSGTSGRDGVSPTLQIVDIEGGHMVRIEDKNGMKSFEVMDGTDYVLTDEDKQEIAGMIEAPSASDEQISAAVNEYLAANPVSGGMSAEARNLLIAILRNAVYSSDQSENITALEAALGTGGTEPDDPEEPDEPIVATYAISSELIHCTSSNSAVSANSGDSYTATLAAADGYTMEGASVSITMGGTDITASAYADGVITISAVTGDVEIIASAAEVQAEAVLPQDGLHAFFDLRNAEIAAVGTGGAYGIAQADIGDASIYAWSSTVTKSITEKGIGLARGLFISNASGATDQVSLGTAYTIMGLAYNDVPLPNYFAQAVNNVLTLKPIYVNTSGSDVTATGSSVECEIANQYRNVAIVVDGAKVQMYLDGVFAAEVDGASLDSFSAWKTVGSSSRGHISTMQYNEACLLAGVAVYKRALSASEIASAYEWMRTNLEVN